MGGIEWKKRKFIKINYAMISNCEFYQKKKKKKQPWSKVECFTFALCVIGNEFPCRQPHNPSAKCEAFPIAPRLFFMFLFFTPFTIPQ